MLAFTPDNWKDHPCVTGRPATEQDVRENRATFVVEGATEADVYSLNCPMPAILKGNDGNEVSVLILQAQYSPSRTTVVYGAIDQLGKHYVATPGDIRILPEPTPEWTSRLEESQ